MVTRAINYVIKFHSHNQFNQQLFLDFFFNIANKIYQKD